MRLVSQLFADSSERYGRYVNVLRASIEQHSPSTPLEVAFIEDDGKDIKRDGRGLARHYLNNARKTKHAAELVRAAKDGELLGLLDADLMVFGDLGTISDIDFDFAYTTRPGPYPFNTGVLFVRVSKATREFFDHWLVYCYDLLADRALFNKYIRRYSGINQAALGLLLEQPQAINIKTLPCRIWNMTGVDLERFGPETKVVHIIGSVRSAALKHGPPASKIVAAIAATWQHYDAGVRVH